eukprot:5814595-Amphidinium_carterae.4
MEQGLLKLKLERLPQPPQSCQHVPHLPKCPPLLRLLWCQRPPTCHHARAPIASTVWTHPMWLGGETAASLALDLNRLPPTLVVTP